MKARIALVASLAVLATSAAHAQGRPDARSMSCGQVQSLINDRGAAVLTTGQHTYDRYVRSSAQCSFPDIAVRATINARDTQSCPVWRCQAVDPIDRRRMITN